MLIRSHFPSAAVLFSGLLISISGLEASVVISEFLASNPNHPDDFTETTDWIEVQNRGAEAADLQGWSLTDDPDEPQKWTFPAKVLAPGEFLIVRASGRDLRVASAVLHTNFSLDGSGEFLGLYDASGQCQTCWQPYPKQFSDVSYVQSANGVSGYVLVPSPGAETTGPILNEFVRDTHFSVDRGFFSTAFNVEITCSTPLAVIRYTTDGSEPQVNTGTVVNGPITISKTTSLRARAFLDGMVPSNTDTQTYVFPQNWVTQPVLPAGFPDYWGNLTTSGNPRVSAVYRMDTRVTNHANLGPQVLPALTQTLPVLCLTGNLADIFGPAGIYANGRSTTLEVPVAVEYFNPLDSADRWTARAGAQMHGGGARNLAKKAFRIDFTGGASSGTLKHPLFPGSPVERFDQLVLRAGSHDGFFTRGRGGSLDNTDLAIHASYFRDQYLRRTEQEAGLLSPRGRYVHLCINGLYWGIYDMLERPNAAWCQFHQGGSTQDWDVVHSSSTVVGMETVDGTLTAFVNLLAEASAANSPAQMDALMTKLGGERFLDHFIIRMWGQDFDWLAPIFTPRSDGVPGDSGNVAYFTAKNWYAVGRTRGVETVPWQFFTWDAEVSMGNNFTYLLLSGNLPSGVAFLPIPHRRMDFDLTAINTPNTPGQLWAALASKMPFRLKLADRLRKHLFNGGVLSPEVARARVGAFEQLLDLPIVAESARWGDSNGFSFAARNGTIYQTWNNTLVGRDTHWRPEVAWMRDSFATQRGGVLLAQFRRRGLYPSLDAPDILPFGGRLQAGQSVTLQHPLGTNGIFFTTDGTDPRDALTNLPSATAQAWNGAALPVPGGRFVLKTRSANRTEWSALTEATFTAAVAPTAGSLAFTEIYYHPEDPSLSEQEAGFDDGDQFEFLEISNLTDDAIHLSTLRFAKGLDFDFELHGDIQELGPRERLVLVSNLAAFRTRFGNQAAVGGEFQNGTNLSNGGEQLKLVTKNGVLIYDVTYNDRGGWPTAADGGGKSLALLAPELGADPNHPESWRASTPTPGAFEPMSWALWQQDYFSNAERADVSLSGPEGDADGDGIANLIEYAVKTNPRQPNGPPISLANREGNPVRIEFSWEQRLDASDFNAVLQLGTLTSPWVSAGVASGTTVTESATPRTTRRHTVSVTINTPHQFARIRVELR